MRLWALLPVTLALVVLLIFIVSLKEASTHSPPTSHTSAPAPLESGSYGDFAVSFYKRIALERLRENLVLSPYSVYKAFAMAYAGAAGETREEIGRVFGFGDDVCALAQAGRGVEEAVAAWVQLGFPLREEYERELSCLGAELRRVDFAERSALVEINRWIEEKTRGYVKDLIPTDYPRSQDIRVVLTSALFFNGSWWPLQFGRIGKREFQGVGPVEFMKLDLGSCVPSLRGRVSADLTVVELRFENTDVAMYVIMPKSLEDYVKGLTYEKLKRDITELPDEIVAVTMPLFTAEFKDSLKKVLIDIGIRSAFDKTRANFTRMSPIRIYIDEVFHGAYIKADEKGVVATAATAVVFVPVCAKVGGMEVVIDRPFLFVLADRRDGTIYFIGHVVKP
ncbi:serpin family protein [Pyrobaculum neutrophilum]|uniref:Proteinase inhibitor I4 serpin n=1 Tax=Pyrobaculum neutrophilum (strain DSM 2338 / JCM 9278 / NBRC 100436 / V24Sta) TaxID=444157 RepID=B1YBN4_PYRNV|nr:serpin family protein [Pyrobaculum neutrophilum]ACB40836.1 proteinase inhibitor I4 serpin [Pyrobaculum neutrophilum V24Sta]